MLLTTYEGERMAASQACKQAVRQVGRKASKKASRGGGSKGSMHYFDMKAQENTRGARQAS